MTTSMHTNTLAALSEKLQAKKISSVELTQFFLDRIARLDPQLNSFITVSPELALHQAKMADQLLSRNSAEVSPLTGIPIAYKDIFCTQGIKTSCGSKMLDNFIAPYTATVVEHLEKSGMVSLGKTNMDEFAMGSSNENSFYGCVRNPWNMEYVPGGSSGGSAAAVAAGLCPASLGTDTGGSVRQPAAFCGITGLKPTYGRLSRYGMVAFASSLDHPGPMAKTAEDIAFLLNALAKHDPKDSTSVPLPDADYTKELHKPLQGLKIGLPTNYFNDNLDTAIADSLQSVQALLQKLGAVFVDIPMPNQKFATAVYYILAPAECSSNLARYDGVRFGYRCNNPTSVDDLYKRSRTEGFGIEVKRRIMLGNYVLSSGYYDAYYLKAQKIRRLIQNDFEKAFQQVDLILTPTTPTPAFKLHSKLHNPVAMYSSDIYTLSANLAGLPAISFPIGFVGGLPIGAQLMGRYFDEALLLNTVHQYQKNTHWHLQTPNLA